MRVRSIGEAAAQVRGRRLQMHLSQERLAQQAGVSRKWVYEFEAGKQHAELGHLLRVLDSLDLQLDLSPSAGSSGTKSSGTWGDTVDLDSILESHRGG